ITGDYDVNKLGSYVITYTATDKYGNTTTATSTLEVINQNAPVITGTNKVVQIKQGESFEPIKGVEAVDFEGNKLQVKVTGDYDLTKVGSYEITYTATDKYGNITTATTTLEVINQDAPTITGVEKAITIKQGVNFDPKAGVNAVDFEGKKLEVKVTGDYDLTKVGSYEITYTAIDEFGNTTIEVMTLTVINQDAPTITIDNKVTQIKQGENFDPKAGVTAVDFEGNELEVTVTGEYDVTKVGSYEITYTATDKYGNTTTVTSTLEVVKQESPVITGANKVIQIRQGENFDPKAGVEAVDFEGKKLELIITGDYDVNKLGSYVITYTVTDEFGNTTTATNTLEVVKQDAPVITVDNKVTQIIEGGSFDPKAGVKAVDFEGNELEVTVTGEYDVNKAGTYEITYTATDKYGNTTTATSTLEVIKQETPVENTETVNVDNGEKVVFDKNKPSNIKIVSSKLQNKDVEYILVNGIKVTKTAIEGKLSRSVEEYFTTSDGAITLSAKLFEDLNLDVKENYTIGVGFTDGNEITELVELVMVDNTVTPPGQNNGNNNSNTNGGNNNNTNNGNTNNGNSNSTTNNNNNNSISKIPTTGAAVASSIIAGLGTVIATIGAYIFKKNK
ncbi:MAG: DUF5011 domain-containing protein, partial [Clostridium sp.]|nr:DUF5011 domain-containing protein [Clostridium sp.]